MPDDPVTARLFVFVYEIRCARKCDLRNVFFDFLFRHADAVVFNGQRAGFFIRRYGDAVIFFCRSLAEVDKFFMLRDGILCVCHNTLDRVFLCPNTAIF